MIRRKVQTKKKTVKRRSFLNLVGVQGFEPWTPWSQTRCATGLRYTPKTAIIGTILILVNNYPRLFIQNR
jgi:hypothetical protein